MKIPLEINHLILLNFTTLTDFKTSNLYHHPTIMSNWLMRYEMLQTFYEACQPIVLDFRAIIELIFDHYEVRRFIRLM